MSGFIVVEYFFGMGEISFRFPTVFAGGVSFPFDKVCVASATSFVQEDSFDFIFRLVIDKVRWWIREVFSVDIVVFEGG